jgi:hypothetical protein
MTRFALPGLVLQRDEADALRRCRPLANETSRPASLLGSSAFRRGRRGDVALREGSGAGRPWDAPSATGAGSGSRRTTCSGSAMGGSGTAGSSPSSGGSAEERQVRRVAQAPASQSACRRSRKRECIASPSANLRIQAAVRPARRCRSGMSRKGSSRARRRRPAAACGKPDNARKPNRTATPPRPSGTRVVSQSEWFTSGGRTSTPWSCMSRTIWAGA